ncbi:MAG: 3-deoxy-7-phosphoheptulonate synthase class II [Pelagibacterales bacterium]|nr:3-deoxy-7-phosphoheptulonate synthase class II [Pelagibacterales bacterium]
MTQNWTVNSWRNFPIKQQPTYDNQDLLKAVEKQLSSFPPLVSFDEIDKLKAELALVSQGKAFLLQGGDCAESFTEFSHDNLKGFFRTVMQMTIALMYGLNKPIVKVGRIAGQYAKPRSEGNETIGDITLPSYRGDIINSIEFEKNSRVADPQRLILSYFYSAASLNYLRSLALGGYGNLEKVNKWNEEFAHSLNSRKNTEEVIGEVNKILDFMRACGLDSKTIPQLTTASFFTSHEALLLNYEEAFTRQSKDNKKFYDLSAHMLWIGDRTRSPNEAHVEFMRGITNPIAFKVGPSISKDDLLKLLEVLNPENEAGRITLISRMGASKVEEILPPLVEAVKKSGHNVVWSCDPMHGNTIKSSNGYKTRKFDDILKEITSFFQVHKSIGTYAGGVHFEMTGQDVTECLGGNQQISEINLKDRYHTHCDPRLNSSQSVELAFMIAQDLANDIKK